MAVIPNATRWGALLAYLLRCDTHYPDLKNCELDDDVLDTISTAVTPKNPRAAGPFETI